ncbi:MAG TPA: N-6 DNA methylase [Planctomycetaceae bacterium]|nr:N-6 DNA methylase [Planctomycetaceae bacterium]
MKFIHEISPDKLRGGFYTPAPVVDACLGRISRLLGADRPLRILEPSAGDGAFVRGLQASADRGGLNGRITCVELLEREAALCRSALQAAGLDGQVIHDSFFAWAEGQSAQFDAVVGNPPFVRFQFVPKTQRSDADRHFARLGRELAGVSNLWIPFVLISLELLRNDGAFALVLPAELLATKSAGLIRSEFVRHFSDLQLDLYPRGSFPSILQDVIVVSGRRCRLAADRRPVRFVEHTATGTHAWEHDIPDAKDSWTRYLLSKSQLAAFEAARQIPAVHRLATVATLGVSIVTGANDFFTVDDATLAEHELQPWARPLLARTGDAPGLVFRTDDHAAARQAGRRAWILDFAADAPNPERASAASRYLESGVQQGLPGRYKCRVRTPWYRVPDVRSDVLMMSKRAHQFHRLLLNRAGAHTTDTIYRGRMKSEYSAHTADLVAGFHNSLTILSSEIEGRTYGGGVLELVPSEIGRLLVPMALLEGELPRLDQLCRRAGGQCDASDSLIEATDTLLTAQLPDLRQILPELREARLHLRRRRFRD